MKTKIFALSTLGILAASVVGLTSNPVSKSASASSELYDRVEEHYEIAGHDLGTDWQMVTSLDELAEQQIVTLAAIDNSMGEPVVKVFDCWSMDHDYISTLEGGSISEGHLYSNNASGIMFDIEKEGFTGYLSTLENGVNEPIGCYKDGDEDFTYFSITPTFTNARWYFEFDEYTHEVKIYQNIEGYQVHFAYWNGCDFFMPTHETEMISKSHMYLFKDNFAHSGTRKLSDVDMEGNSLIYNFANALLDTFDGVCDPTGNTNQNTLAAAIMTIYKSDESDVLRRMSKKVFKYTIADENGNVVQQAAALYDYIMLKYTQYLGYEWFERSEFYPKPSSSTTTVANNVSAIAVCSIAGVALLGFAALEITKKRKAKAK